MTGTATAPYIEDYPQNHVTPSAPPSPKPCPSCGRCPTCGRGRNTYIPFQPWGPYTNPYRYPNISGPVISYSQVATNPQSSCTHTDGL